MRTAPRRPPATYPLPPPGPASASDWTARRPWPEGNERAAHKPLDTPHNSVRLGNAVHVQRGLEAPINRSTRLIGLCGKVRAGATQAVGPEQTVRPVRSSGAE